MNEDTEKKVLLIGVGSNLGNRYLNIYKASCLLSEKLNSDVVVSNIYESLPWGETEQPRFLNTVVKAETNLNAIQVLEITQSLELEMGRVITKKWGPRVIDLDLLYLGNEVLNEERLSLPHQYMAERNFVYTPLFDLAPNFIDPLKELKLTEIYKPDFTGLSLFAPSHNTEIKCF